jgi:hypothetical protein
MELARLILEYLKVLAWPIVVVGLLLHFRRPLAAILSAIGEKLASAETVKVGVLGQEVEISGTAKELKAERQELLAAPSEDREARAKAKLVERAIPDLNNPIADIVGIALLRAPKDGLSVDDLIGKVLSSFGTAADMAKPQARLVLTSMSREVDKVLANLTGLKFAVPVAGRYSLTNAGRDFFKRVAAREEQLLARFVSTSRDADA